MTTSRAACRGTLMKPHLLIVLAVVAATAPERASAQLVSERVEGSQRICTYRDNYVPSGGREYRVGVGEACAVSPPTERSSLPPPPTARLVSSSEKDGMRVCAYSQRNRSWSFELPLDTLCPINAGMLAAMQSTDRDRDD